MGSSEKSINKLITPEYREKVELTPEEKDFADKYRNETSKLHKGDKHLTFSNVIRKQGRCGFAGGGTTDYLINTDTQNRYRVTVRTFWRSGNNSGQFDRVVMSEAGGRFTLGCTDSGYMPVTYYTRQVVGEMVV